MASSGQSFIQITKGEDVEAKRCENDRLPPYVEDGNGQNPDRHGQRCGVDMIKKNRPTFF